MSDLTYYNNFLRRYVSDEVHWYWDHLTLKIIAESGIPTDNHHIGKIFLRVFKDYPERICQIDGATDQSYTNRDVLEKTVRCATAFTTLGIQKGDTIAILGPNHLDLTMPFYASFYVGVIAAGVDRTLRPKQLSGVLTIIKPKIIFCQDEKSADVEQALQEGNLVARIVTFNKGSTHTHFAEFLEKYGGQEPIEEFKATDFDPDTTAYLLSTSGTTGPSKLVAVTHKNLSIGGRAIWANYTNFPTPTRLNLILSSLYWQTATIMHVTTPIMGVPRIQSSEESTQENFYYLLKKYKPTLLLTTPTRFSGLMKPGEYDPKLLRCLQNLCLGGSFLSKKLLQEIKDISPETTVTITYATNEMTTLGFHYVDGPFGCSGKPLGCFKYRLVNLENNEVIHEPNVPGELWLKGPPIFKGYYNNPAETAKVITSDGWYKTGDIFRRDENDYYFYCDRLQLRLKYLCYQISPAEIENVIRNHPGVHDVVVTGRPDPFVGDLAVACVVLRHGYDVKSEEIEDLVKESLAEPKHIRGGVVFLKEMPLLPTGKVDKQKLRAMVNGEKDL